MPKELTLLEEFDIIAELQFPDFVYATDSSEEKIAFAEMVSNLSNRRIMLLDDALFDFPYIVAGLQESHVETIVKESDHDSKKKLFENLNDRYFLGQVKNTMEELNRREKTTENSDRLKNILQYINDNKSII